MRRRANDAGQPIRVVAYTDATALGGSGAVFASLLGGLAPRFEVTVLGIDRDVVESVAAARPGSKTRLVRPARSKWDLPGIAAHVSAVRDLRPDILHANLPYPWSCTYGIVAGILTPGVRTIAVQHAILPPRVRRQAWLNHLTLSRLDAHVALTERQGLLIEEMARLPRGSMRIIPNGVADTPVDPVSRPVAGPIVGAVGRLSPEKGYDLLVRSLQRIPELTAVLVGAGHERAELERLASEFGVSDRLILPGWASEPRAWMDVFDVFAIPSRSEGMPLVLIEAMLASLPVVATDVGGIRDVMVDEETGLLVPPEDADALASALLRLLGDERLRAQMGSAGRGRAQEEFSLEKMVKSYEHIYDELMGAEPS